MRKTWSNLKAFERFEHSGTAEKYDFRKVHMQNDAKKVELSCAKFRFKEDIRAKRLEIHYRDCRKVRF